MTENTTILRSDLEAAIGRDLQVCDVGLALTKGKTRRRYAQHRKACMQQIAAWNIQDGLDKMTDDELLAELMG